MKPGYLFRGLSLNLSIIDELPFLACLRHHWSESRRKCIGLLQYHNMSIRPHSPERPRSPSNPTITYHPSLFPSSIPTPALLESVAGGAHYSGVKIERDTAKIRRHSSGVRTSHIQIKGDHQRVLDDMNELYCCRPTREIFERRWRPDASFEVRRVIQVI
jgi:hypothetical protein